MEPNNPQIQPKPNNHLALAIITTILCCLPAGIVSIVYATQVNSKYNAGDYEGALRSSKNAKTWWIVSIITALIIIVGYFVVVFIIIGENPEIMEEFQKEIERQQSLQNQ
ncbi:CD225/dispanin family protein [Psychroflexus salis]|uniref:Interferon-induced transmembrane protein n=1 Tax=Psychroflexus salis TaxID=1526574 RepID=A0A917E777_9FLAO|nr:CD225/dispanin family protein [Psychroflexus salis]GGE11660.1 hypothetical protein GCM10010831_11370 [Psychroflexus salis]